MEQNPTNGPSLPIPLFLPVFEPGNAYLPLAEMQQEFGVDAIMTNAFFLYRQRSLRRSLPERGVKDYLGFRGTVVTDSGAFQAFRGRLLLSNRRIIRFQEDIGADVISPLDVVTPPSDNFATAEGKLSVTMRRIEEGLALAHRATLMGVQQGGRFLELRRRAADWLAGAGISYAALGSLVPFFTRNHDLRFARRVIETARAALPDGLPLHLYGAGDPLEIPFYVAMGCTVFDSSSYVHYAENGSYMTPYGALPAGQAPGERGWNCPCPFCRREGDAVVRADTSLLCRHNLWTILETVRTVRAAMERGALPAYLDEVARVHGEWFPDSLLGQSWPGGESDDA
jgi:7-cyano-7-deazaguanine tRNA-ribosyltransferase